MKPIVSIMAQGSMGAATGARLVEKGIEVRTVVAGRSAASAERARQAGMKPVSEDELVELLKTKFDAHEVVDEEKRSAEG